jgi:hypothetical protein
MALAYDLYELVWNVLSSRNGVPAICIREKGRHEPAFFVSGA